MKISKQVTLTTLFILATLYVLSGLPPVANAYETKSDRQNRVSVAVTPIQFVQGKPAKFQVRMNTHSVSLVQDMVAVCTLKDDQGREYRPVSWQGSPPGGHHRQGILEFPALEGKPKRLTLVIRDVADILERKFEWELSQ